MRETGFKVFFSNVNLYRYNAEKLTKFLSLNPSVPRERSFVDESRTFDAYEAAGFGRGAAVYKLNAVYTHSSQARLGVSTLEPISDAVEGSRENW